MRIAAGDYPGGVNGGSSLGKARSSAGGWGRAKLLATLEYKFHLRCRRTRGVEAEASAEFQYGATYERKWRNA